MEGSLIRLAIGDNWDFTTFLAFSCSLKNGIPLCPFHFINGVSSIKISASHYGMLYHTWSPMCLCLLLERTWSCLPLRIACFPWRLYSKMDSPMLRSANYSALVTTQLILVALHVVGLGLIDTDAWHMIETITEKNNIGYKQIVRIGRSWVQSMFSGDPSRAKAFGRARKGTSDGTSDNKILLLLGRRNFKPMFAYLEATVVSLLPYIVLPEERTSQLLEELKGHDAQVFTFHPCIRGHMSFDLSL
ncbi:hypothetical protein SADUNF_Sadunf15G0045100 [Salix dunnii]|uniref:Uncharacterized protein n=1 Tax=Salix dunnii TaxID=1413687 RepID=A0A835MS58_9ROSI|nr:hypothetical protein SADUNF_Sadunf15G0045100 [Salix dunnii]